ncbi:Asp23/Gls24 family envelope stress response protein [Streptomyces sp. ISL-22]|nr:Asp23/Gls24 family envelope stress response protein [Streptomyces sp. ISL-24]MBT2436482.1 Asp23/Gls24 family envelope stress response protein [Streptomyces sp. ISL-22]
MPPGARGAIRISDRVIAKIASHAAREALGEFPGTRQVPFVHASARASVSVRPADGRGAAERAADEVSVLGEARVHVAVELHYPCDIGRQCGTVRRVVTERVQTLTGMDVDHVSVTVERLHAARGPAPVEGRVR